MSTLIGAMDAMGMQEELSSENKNIQAKIQYGENINIEYCWSKNIRENITQFYFQLTQSTNDNSIYKLKMIYRNLINNILTISTSTKTTLTPTPVSNENPINAYTQITEEDRKISAITIYKMIGQTRDIVSGKGLYNLSYMMIAEWARYSIVGPPQYKEMCEHLACEAITSFVKIDTESHPYGSWKDMKYFCNYWGKIEDELLYSHPQPPQSQQSQQSQQNYNNRNKPHKIILTILNLICTQLKRDETKLSNNEATLSLLAKWIPREKSKKFGWLTHHIAYTYYSEYLINAMGKPNEMVARKKCLTHFRKTITKLNKSLNTPQIDQCQQTWKNIDFDKNVTSITMRKQSLAFQNITKKNNPRNNMTDTSKEDREECATNYKEYINRCATNKSIAKGANVSMIDFVKSAIENESSNNELEKSIINSQWKNNGFNVNKLGNIIAMVDTSGSMESDNGIPLYSAIGLGIRVAEKSALGRRLITFSSTPEWINLDDIDEKDFVAMVQKVRRAPWGMNTNFYAALNLILQTIVENNLDPKTVENMTLVIFSDMQIDAASNVSIEKMDTMFETIKKLYEDAGLKTSYNCAYKVPHILFWNLRTTNGFPCISSNKNTSMMSGSSPALLNLFCNKGIEVLKECTPWNMLQEALSNPRYNILETTIREALNIY